MIQKQELGEIVVDDLRSYSIAKWNKQIYLTLYVKQGEETIEDRLVYSLDAHTYHCDETEEITLASIQAELATAEGFDKYVALAQKQENYEYATHAKTKANIDLEKTDYRKIKFVCALIDALAADGTIEDLRQLAKDFLVEYPNETSRCETERTRLRSATKVIENAEIGVV